MEVAEIEVAYCEIFNVGVEIGAIIFGTEYDVWWFCWVISVKYKLPYNTTAVSIRHRVCFMHDSQDTYVPQ